MFTTKFAFFLLPQPPLPFAIEREVARLCYNFMRNEKFMRILCVSLNLAKSTCDV